MTFVIDASVTMAWCFEDERNSYSDALLDRLLTEGGITPLVWPLEVVNTLLIAERKNRLSPERSAQFIDVLMSLPIEVVFAEDAGDLMNSIAAIGRESGLSSYDASYVRLALAEGCPLATNDVKMRRACERLGLSLV